MAHRFDGMDARFDGMDDRFACQTAEITAAFRGEITAAMTLQTRQTVFAIIGVLLAVAAPVAAVLGLGRRCSPGVYPMTVGSWRLSYPW